MDKEKELDNINQDKENRSDYFSYKKGDIQIVDSQCDLCIYNNPNDSTKCKKYPVGKPKKVVKAEILCEYLEEKDKIEL